MDIVGNLLIAPPAVKNNFWHKTVILVTEHHAHGSVGLVLNKRSQMSIPEFSNQLGFDINLPGFIYVGGPVSPKNLSFLPRMAAGDTPEYWRICLGLCGWGPGQLDAEIQGTPPWKHANSWCVANSSLDLIFGNDHTDQWCSALDRSGLEFAQSILT